LAEEGPVRYPWECPRCVRVNAPWMDQCMCLPGTPRLTVDFVAPRTLPPTEMVSIPRTRTVSMEPPPAEPLNEYELGYGYGPLPTASWVGRRDD